MSRPLSETATKYTKVVIKPGLSPIWKDPQIPVWEPKELKLIWLQFTTILVYLQHSSQTECLILSLFLISIMMTSGHLDQIPSSSLTFFFSWSTPSCQEILLSLLSTYLWKLTPSYHLHCYGGHHPLTWIVPEPPASPPPSLPSSTRSSLSDTAVNVCVPPKFKHWRQSPSEIALGSGAFGKWLGLDEVRRAETQVGIRVFIRWRQNYGASSLSMWGPSEKAGFDPAGRSFSTEAQSCQNLILNLNCEKITFCYARHPVYCILLWLP